MALGRDIDFENTLINILKRQEEITKLMPLSSAKISCANQDVVKKIVSQVVQKATRMITMISLLYGKTAEQKNTIKILMEKKESSYAQVVKKPEVRQRRH